MKRIMSICAVFVLVVFGAQAQSKKVVNQQLRMELTALQNTADSIETLYNDRQREIKYMRGEVVEKWKELQAQAAEENAMKSSISQYRYTLNDYGFDSGSLVSLAEIDALVSPKVNYNDLAKTEMTKSFFLADRPEVENIADLKIKIQNETMTKEIAEFREINARNKVAIAEQQEVIKQLKGIKKEFTALQDEYEELNETLASRVETLKTKYLELKKIREEEERLKREKELALASKKKGKAPKTTEFVPPIVVDSNDSEDSVVGESDRNFGGNWDRDVSGELNMPEPPKPPVILDYVEQAAEFPGGQQAMRTYLSSNLKYPQTALDSGKEGKCYLKFVISESGNVSNVKVLRGVPDCPECDQEAIRVLQNMPNWVPAKNDGQAVNCWYTIPISFKLVSK